MRLAVSSTQYRFFLAGVEGTLFSHIPPLRILTISNRKRLTERVRYNESLLMYPGRLPWSLLRFRRPPFPGPLTQISQDFPARCRTEGDLSTRSPQNRTFGVMLLDEIASALASKMATSIEIPLRDTEDEVHNQLNSFTN